MTNQAEDAPLFQEPDRKLFFSRGDLADPRLGEFVRDLPSSHTLDESLLIISNGLKNTTRPFVLAGYADDEGIRINGGRLGAASAPDEIKKALYKMTPSLSSDKKPTLVDLGNLQARSLDLATRHSTITRVARETLACGARWIGIGGGHDYGFADASAFCLWLKDTSPSLRPLVINFDAHLDVRPVANGLSSGTPFFRMLESFPDVDFAEIGIQSQCNSRSHLEWVQARGVRTIMQDEIEASAESMLAVVKRRLDGWLTPSRPTFLSIDIDGFSSAVAPGCSQSWATGFMPHDFFPLLSYLLSQLDVKILGIYEVSPPLDQDSRTAKLAAQIIHRYLFSGSGK